MTAPPQVLAVIVLYGQEPAHARTLTGLAAAFAEDPALASALDLLVWDNSPDRDPGHGPRARAVAALPLACRYQASTRNEGVSGAYNAAAAIAAAGSHRWLLLLDQDTSVTLSYLRAMLAALETADAEATVAAIVPLLYAGDFQLSPRLWRFARHVPLPPRPGREAREIFAANSGALVRIQALQAVGGYSRRFWLDYSDIELFHRLYRQGWAVWVVPQATLQHDIAMMDYDARMSPERYAIYLAAESDFLDLYRGLAERLLHLGRLAVRMVRQRRLRNPAFSRMSAQELLRRIVRRRRSRLTDRAV